MKFTSIIAHYDNMKAQLVSVVLYALPYVRKTICIIFCKRACFLRIQNAGGIRAACKSIFNNTDRCFNMATLCCLEYLTFESLDDFFFG